MAEEALRQAADAIIREARERKASDIHISEGMPIWYRVNGRLLPAQTQMCGGGDSRYAVCDHAEASCRKI